MTYILYRPMNSGVFLATSASFLEKNHQKEPKTLLNNVIKIGQAGSE